MYHIISLTTGEGSLTLPSFQEPYPVSYYLPSPFMERKKHVMQHHYHPLGPALIQKFDSKLDRSETYKI